MAVGCGAKCAKYMLIFFNFLFWLSGAGILGIGIWLLVDKSIVEVFKLVSLDQSDPWLNYAAYVFIGVGIFVFIVGFCGCCGAIRESKCLLGLYIGFLFIVMAGELAAGILAFIYKDKVKSELQGFIGEQLRDQAANSTFFLSMAFAQKTFQCCGVQGPMDYKQSNYSKMMEEIDRPKLPPTCCVLKEDSKDVDFKDVTYSNVENQNECNKEDNWKVVKDEDNEDKKFVHLQGCYYGILNFFNEKAIILIAVGIGLACLEIFGFIFAVCLCRNIGEEL